MFFTFSFHFRFTNVLEIIGENGFKEHILVLYKWCNSLIISLEVKSIAAWYPWCLVFYLSLNDDYRVRKSVSADYLELGKTSLSVSVFSCCSSWSLIDTVVSFLHLPPHSSLLKS